MSVLERKEKSEGEDTQIQVARRFLEMQAERRAREILVRYFTYDLLEHPLYTDGWVLASELSHHHPGSLTPPPPLPLPSESGLSEGSLEAGIEALRASDSVPRAVQENILVGSSARWSVGCRKDSGTGDLGAACWPPLHWLVQGVVAMEAASLLASPESFVGAWEIDWTCVSFWASKSSKTCSSSEMQRARARACPWRSASVTPAAVHAGQDGGSIMPSAVKMMWRQHMLSLVRVPKSGGDDEALQ